MKNSKNAQVAIAFICMLLGIMISMQFKTIRKQQVTVVQKQRADELSLELKRVLEEKEVLMTKLLDNQKKLRDYEEAVSQNSSSFTIIKKELEEARILAGLSDVEGPGVTVTLNDNKVGIQQNATIDPNTFLIHDDDIMAVINELNAAGAEAVSLNNQRLIATSAVRCVGPVVSVNQTRVAAPFQISAIGDPDALEAALRLPGGVIDYLAPWGIEISIKKSEKILIPKYEQPLQFKRAITVYKKEG